MNIKLVFENIPEDIGGAIADIRIEDQSEADAPALQLFSKNVGPFAIRQAQPVIDLDVDLSVVDRNHELSILIRVKGYTQSNQPVKFFNTATTPLPNDLSGALQVTLSRIA